ncbi:hypothetical protein FCULG_00005075 [Fusarium culmorum]|uniref:Uncharacterized protein n=1 Tax=Fusarium culmorum TaxID=5516 RepID=A0A2T4HCG8_FUSCU|nr:hypothetical protein FCULG_00005075 [Fusarium culmorum]
MLEIFDTRPPGRVFWECCLDEKSHEPVMASLVLGRPAHRDENRTLDFIQRIWVDDMIGGAIANQALYRRESQLQGPPMHRDELCYENRMLIAFGSLVQTYCQVMGPSDGFLLFSISFDFYSPYLGSVDDNVNTRRSFAMMVLIGSNISITEILGSPFQTGYLNRGGRRHDAALRFGISLAANAAKPCCKSANDYGTGLRLFLCACYAAHATTLRISDITGRISLMTVRIQRSTQRLRRQAFKIEHEGRITNFIILLAVLRVERVYDVKRCLFLRLSPSPLPSYQESAFASFILDGTGESRWSSYGIIDDFYEGPGCDEGTQEVGGSSEKENKITGKANSHSKDHRLGHFDPVGKGNDQLTQKDTRRIMMITGQTRETPIERDVLRARKIRDLLAHSSSTILPSLLMNGRVVDQDGPTSNGSKSIYFGSTALQSSNVRDALPILRVIPDLKNTDGAKWHAKSSFPTKLKSRVLANNEPTNIVLDYELNEKGLTSSSEATAKEMFLENLKETLPLETLTNTGLIDLIMNGAMSAFKKTFSALHDQDETMESHDMRQTTAAGVESWRNDTGPYLAQDISLNLDRDKTLYSLEPSISSYHAMTPYHGLRYMGNFEDTDTNGPWNPANLVTLRTTEIYNAEAAPEEMTGHEPFIVHQSNQTASSLSGTTQSSRICPSCGFTGIGESSRETVPADVIDDERNIHNHLTDCNQPSKAEDVALKAPLLDFAEDHFERQWQWGE